MERILEKTEADKNRERVLNYFIDPENSQMDYEDFAKTLLQTAVGGNPTNPEQEKIFSEMNKLTGEVKNARRFNDTYIGHMLSEASIPAMVAHMMATRLGSNTVAPEVSKMETKLEPEAIRFLLDIVGYNPDEASGTFTSGGSMAAFTALAVARKKVQKQFEEKRQKSPEKLFVFATPMAHYCLDKAIDYLGGQNRGIEKVMVDTVGLRMSPADLELKIREYSRKGVPMAIYAIAGETETGLVDPLPEIADIAEEYGIFSIADAAYGAPYKMSRKGELFTDMPRYDSVIVDGHKALYTPYPNGAVLFRDARDHVLFGMGVKASYVQLEDDAKKFLNALLYKSDEGSFMLGKKRPEGSGSAGSILSTVATKRTLGKEGLAAVFDITLDRIDFLYQRLVTSDYLVPFHEPDVNVLCFTLSERAEHDLNMVGLDEKEKNEKRKKVLEEVRATLNKNDNGDEIEGETGYFLSSTNLQTDEVDSEETEKQGKVVKKMHYVLRAVLMNPRTSNEILDKAVEKIEKTIQGMISLLDEKENPSGDSL